MLLPDCSEKNAYGPQLRPYPRVRCVGTHRVVVSLEGRFKRKLNASVVIEPELIGGIRVVVGDEVLDTSVKARLEQMRVALTA